MSGQTRYRYRVMGQKGEGGLVAKLEDFAYDYADASERAAFHRRWGWTAWVERQEIVSSERDWCRD